MKKENNMNENLQLATQIFQATKIGLLVSGTPTKEDWLNYGSNIREVEGALQWVIGDWLNQGEKRYGETYIEAMKLWPEDECQTLRVYKSIAEALPLLIRINNLTWSHHREVAYLKLPEIVPDKKLPQGRMQWSKEPDTEKISEFLFLAETKKLTVRELRLEIESYKRKKEAEFALHNSPQKYDVIYADPPWKYNDKCIEGAIQSGGASSHYPVMSIQELCRLSIKSISSENSVLFLWITAPIISECWPVIEGWGFKYKAMFVWDKVRHNMGHYNSVRHELLLICTRGSYLPLTETLEDSVQVIERTDEHSRKPEEFRNLIEKMYPEGRKIELFARGLLPEGWDSWGDEA